MSKFFNDVKKGLSTVSPSFCLAKWLQVTVHLQNGQTHSCHHPHSHKIPLSEIENNPSALHNTNQKKEARKQMLKGERPQECEYCWLIEDAHQDSISDRVLKSANDFHELDRVANLPWDSNVIPNYIEVSFGNECNFKCAYCVPNISSAIMSEYQKHGHYTVMPDFGIDSLKESGLFPYGKDEFNPYVDAFWKWWPELKEKIKVFRITGGEPLLNNNTFRFLDDIIKTPLAQLSVAINTNMGIPDYQFENFLKKIEIIQKNKLVKSFSLFTSVDTYGKNGEFIRFGMKYDEVMKRCQTFLERIPEVQLNFMCTYNAFSVVHFDKFLADITRLKKAYRSQNGENRVYLNTPYLKDPNFLSCKVLTEDFFPYLKRDIDYLKKHSKPQGNEVPLYSESEVSGFERILHWLESQKDSENKEQLRANLYFFLKEYQERKEIKLKDYCPEYLAFYARCKVALVLIAKQSSKV